MTQVVSVHVHAPVLGHSGHALSNRNLGQTGFSRQVLRQLELWLHSLHHPPELPQAFGPTSVVKNRWRNCFVVVDLYSITFAGMAANTTGPIEA
jgi:hypothetical protein